MGAKSPKYTLIPMSLDDVRCLIEENHGYGTVGNVATYVFGVVEQSGARVVAAYVWQPPAPGAAKSVCPEEPAAVLSLSRMAAVPRSDRELRHVSTPLRRQMRDLIDRSRWPVLVTYHDEGQGHCGHVYRCSGWTPTMRARRAVFQDSSGRRVSKYSNGADRSSELVRVGDTWLQRWERWACEPGKVKEHMLKGGWERVPIKGKAWRSGNQAFEFVKIR